MPESLKQGLALCACRVVDHINMKPENTPATAPHELMPNAKAFMELISYQNFFIRR